MQWFTMNWMSISFLNTDPSATVPINPILSCHFCPAALTSDSSCITSGWFPDNASATWSYKRCAPEQADLARLSNPDKRVGLILVTSSFSRKKPHLQPVMSLYWLIHTFQCFTFTQTPKCSFHSRFPDFQNLPAASAAQVHSHRSEEPSLQVQYSQNSATKPLL